MTQSDPRGGRPLLRVLGLPVLILYGVGVTIGAGIFVLVGTVLETAGPRAPLAFLIAGLVAGVTAFSYATLARGFPHAAGASLYVKAAFGPRAGLPVGLGVALTAVVSSATITLGFTGYLAELIDIPRPVTVLVALALVGLLVARGVKESVGVAALLTVIEVGVLLVVVAAGGGGLASAEVWTAAFGMTGPLPLAAVLSAAVIAFFAFIGFEDIVNMAEETVEAERVVAAAIIGTLAITTAIYLAVILIAVGAPDPRAIADSAAPLAEMWTQTTGASSAWLSSLALVAVINGAIVQVIMASRLLYGMARERMLPDLFAHVGRRHTPTVAIWIVTACIAVLALTLPIQILARATSTVTLLVFVGVNLSLVVLGSREGADDTLRRRRWIGVLGAVLTGSLVIREMVIFVGSA